MVPPILSEFQARLKLAAHHLLPDAPRGPRHRAKLVFTAAVTFVGGAKASDDFFAYGSEDVKIAQM